MDPKIRPIELLTKRDSYKKDVNEKVREIISGIEDAIRDAHDNKHRSTVYSLPTVFNIPGISMGNAQKYVYFNVLKALNTAGYITKIRFIGEAAEKQEVKLIITWKTPEVKLKENEMDAYISKYTENIRQNSKK